MLGVLCVFEYKWNYEYVYGRFRKKKSKMVDRTNFFL